MLATALALSPPASAEKYTCPEVTLPPISLPHLRKALTKGDEVTIIALGSSSTEGVRASDPAHSYPAVLQRYLEREMPKSHIVVLNRGLGGEDASDEFARLQRDVLAVRPAVVIWQVGANGAMRNMPLPEFERFLTEGVRELRSAHIDVVLMDNQRAPAILASPEHAQIDQILADVAGREGARLFARGALMGLWQQAGSPYSEFLNSDGIHHNDRGYHCLGVSVGASFIAGLGPPRPQLHASE